jgi:predicted nucleic acid-binding protein
MTDKLAVIDTNVLVAISDSQDKWHKKALILLDMLKIQGVRIIYFDCVLSETVSVMARRAEEQKRSNQFPALLDNLLQNIPLENITWISLEIQKMYSDVMKLIRDHFGILNFNDSLIALSCRDLNIGAIVSFDRDFDQISWLQRISLPEDVRDNLLHSSETLKD